MKKIIALSVVLTILISACVVLSGCDEKELTPKEKIESIPGQLEELCKDSSPFDITEAFVEALNNYDVNIGVDELTYDGESLLLGVDDLSVSAKGAFSATGATSALKLKLDSDEIAADIQTSNMKTIELAMPEATESVIKFSLSDTEASETEALVKNFISAVTAEDRITESEEDITSLGKEYKKADRYDITVTNDEIFSLADKLADSFKLGLLMSTAEEDLGELVSEIKESVKLSSVVSFWFNKNDVVKAQLVLNVEVNEDDERETYKITVTAEGIADNGNADIAVNAVIENGSDKIEIASVGNQTFKNGDIEGNVTAEIRGEGELYELMELPFTKITVKYDGTASAKSSDINYTVSVESDGVAVNIPFNVKTELTDNSIKIAFNIDATVMEYKAKLSITAELSKGEAPAYKTYDADDVLDISNIDETDEEAGFKLIGVFSEIGTYAEEKCPALSGVISSLMGGDDYDDEPSYGDIIASLNADDMSVSLDIYGDGTAHYSETLKTVIKSDSIKASYNGVDLTFKIIDEETVSVNDVEYEAMSFEWSGSEETIYSIWVGDNVTYTLSVGKDSADVIVGEKYEMYVEDDSRIILTPIDDNGEESIELEYKFINENEIEIDGDTWLYAIYSDDFTLLGDYPQLANEDEDYEDEFTGDLSDLVNEDSSRM